MYINATKIPKATSTDREPSHSNTDAGYSLTVDTIPQSTYTVQYDYPTGSDIILRNDSTGGTSNYGPGIRERDGLNVSSERKDNALEEDQISGQRGVCFVLWSLIWGYTCHQQLTCLRRVVYAWSTLSHWGSRINFYWEIFHQ
jgi:hypothetical protein